MVGVVFAGLRVCGDWVDSIDFDVGFACFTC